jgi:hypothetical protein
MPSMDRARRIGGLVWVALGLGFQLVWFLGRSVVPGPVTLLLGALVVLLAVVTVAGSAGGRWLAGWAVAVLVAVEFGGAVADRFGAWGPPGAPGVFWGSWPAFVGYTARLLPGAGHDVVVVAAAAATAAEVALGVLLLSGWQRRWVGKATAGLLVVYLVAMSLTVGADAVATFGVPVLVGGALLVSTCPARRPAGRRPGHVLARPASRVGSGS